MRWVFILSLEGKLKVLDEVMQYYIYLAKTDLDSGGKPCL